MTQARIRWKRTTFILSLTIRPRLIWRKTSKIATRIMIGVFVTFRYGDNFDERAVRKIAETARARFEGMPGLRSKAFTLNSARREATNFYVWE